MLILEQQRRQFGLRRHDVIANRRVVSPKSERTYQHELADPSRIGRRDFTGDHPTERMPDYRRRLESELVEQIVVVEDQVQDVVERLVCVLVARGDSRMLWGIDSEALAEFLEQLGLDRPVTAVQINQRRTAADYPDLGMDLVAPYAD